jgi:pimeloyl-ACP methyl ester carboxylesterase
MAFDRRRERSFGEPPISLGSRAVVATLAKKLDDATLGNEARKAGDASSARLFDTNPILFKMRAFFEVGFSKRDEESRLGAFLAAAEKAWGTPITTQARPAHVSSEDWNAHLVDKAITLVRLGRAPDDVRDGFVHAKGKVDGHAIAERDIFTQTWAPIGEPSGKTIVISPGFLETGRNYVEQIEMVNKLGHKVVVMDHQWAGLSEGKKGGIDRGFGITRDVAAVAADAAQDGNEAVLVGTSMGGGAGVAGALLMNDAGKIDLDGPQMPTGLNGVLQHPFFASSGGVINAFLSATGKVFGVKEIPLPDMGVPILSGDQATLRKLAAHATTEHLSGRPQAFHASDEDLATMKKMLASGVRPQGKLEIIHATKDTLASFEATDEWSKLLGAHLQPYESTTHVPEENPEEQGLLLDALRRLP